MIEIRLGTRGSPLALAQASIVADDLRRLGASDVTLEIIRTHGDEETAARPFTAPSGKALFTQRIEEALLADRIDAAVHSLKDLPAESLPGIVLAAVPRREDPRDALVSMSFASIESLPQGAVVATSSLRRKAQLVHLRPDLDVQPVRGNVETRISKLRNRAWAATVLAAAGLRRLGIEDDVRPINPGLILPAPGQGALAIQTLATSAHRPLVASLQDAASRAAVEAERFFAHRLGADCNTPVGALAETNHKMLRLTGCVVSADGKRNIRHTVTGRASDPFELGNRLAQIMLDQGAGTVLAGAQS